MNDFLNERCGEILDILIDTNKPITIDDISKEISVSNRTIRNDLNKIQEYLEATDKGELIKKPRVGVWIKVDSEGKRFLKNVILKSKNYIQPFSPEKRQLYIIKRLLQSNDSITMQLLADELYVSRVTIYKDLDEVDEWLDKYDLKLKRRQNYGIEIVGNEKGWRKATADLLSILKDEEELKDMLSDTQDIKPNSRLDYENYMQLKELFPNIDVKKIEVILNEAEDDMDFLLSDEAFDGLLAHIVISIERLKQKKDIKMDKKQLDAIKKQKEFEIAHSISKRIEDEFNIKVPECEIGYISLHVLGSKVQRSYNIKGTEDVLSNMDESIISLAKDIISLIGNILSVDFSGDEKLLIGLVLHLRPTINRLKYGLSLRNPILKEIKTNYPSVFGAAWATSVLFEKHFGVKVNEEEIGYIAIHLGAALERLNKNTRAIVVCSSGIGTAQLVAVKLQKSISNLQIVDVISAHDLNKKHPNNFDIIISTIPLKYQLKQVIQINPFVNKGDIERIKRYISNIENTKHFNKDAIQNPMIELFDKELIIPNLDVESKEIVIKKLGNILVDNGYVNSNFIKSALEREKITSTAVSERVAIPHGTHDNVNKSGIAVATLKQPVNWGENKIDTVFLLALKVSSPSYTKSFFKRFYSILNNEEVLDEIRNSKDGCKIYNILVRKDDDNE
ncbi:BglG family transcription antiterminator [Sporosalibacterium faouarense]|uniref:BglG family transcription antiterminator n=1 Tax=Sporosalibacterium faouarense TaxID=516123 RepID=UPI00141C1ABA|nr:BglG family transcription antiterminator [Sporosalibacterium faouarense]MTI47544.1 transcription antiterminator [Bacillota bacterium]